MQVNSSSPSFKAHYVSCNVSPSQAQEIAKDTGTVIIKTRQGSTSLGGKLTHIFTSKTASEEQSFIEKFAELKRNLFEVVKKSGKNQVPEYNKLA